MKNFKKNNSVRSLFQSKCLTNIFIIILIVVCLLILKKLNSNYDNEIHIGNSAHIISGFPYISDGDSIKINKQRIRLLGIDAPELSQFCSQNGQQFACGEMSKQHLKKIINGKKVSCKWIERDKYNRILGQCFVENIDISRQMVEDGWAVSYSNYPKEERYAKNKKLGMWVWQVQRPNQWRKEHPRHD